MKTISRRGMLGGTATVGALSLLVANSEMTNASTLPEGNVYNVIAELGKINDASLIRERSDKAKPTWEYSPRSGAKLQGTDKAKEIQDLINKVSADGGGTVYFPAGGYRVNGLSIPANVNICGAGSNLTFIYLNDGSNRSVISNRLADGKSYGNSYGFRIQDLTVNGNRWGQVFDWYAKKPNNHADPHINMSHGILLHRVPTNMDNSTDSGTGIFNVNVENTYHNGFHVKEHGGEVRLINCVSSRVGGYGFVTGWDQHIIGCSAGRSGYDGFHIRHGQSMFVNCKSWMSGYTCNEYLLEGTWYATRRSAGFYIDGPGHITMNSINAQNNTGAGIVLKNTYGVQITGLVDSNNMSAVADDSGWYTISDDFYSHKDQTNYEQSNGIDIEWRKAKPWSFSGVELQGDSSNNIIDVISWCCQIQGKDKMGYQRHAISIQDSANSNHIRVSHSQQKEVTDRVAADIINPKTSNTNAIINNYVTDSRGGLLAGGQITPQTTIPGDEPGVEDLKRQLNELQAKVDELSARKQSWVPPIIQKSARGDKYEHMSIAIDNVSQRLMIYNSYRRKWYFVHDNAEVK